jgi:CheY-like chemotaxis protein
MGGTLDVTSQPGQGSTFWFAVPLEERESVLDPIQAGETPAVKGDLAGRVLIVEDNESNRLMVRDMLARRGLDCIEAGNGEEALLALATEGELDLILMDCQMPIMDGYETTRHIREREGTREGKACGRIPIVALTANASREDRRRCLGEGMDDYLAKPFRMAELFEMVDKWLPQPSEPKFQEA